MHDKNKPLSSQLKLNTVGGKSLQVGGRQSGGLSISGLGSLKDRGSAKQNSGTGTLQNQIKKQRASALSAARETLIKSSVDLYFILDRSGSCGNVVGTTCESYEELLQKNRSQLFRTRVTTVLFNENIDFYEEKTDISMCKPLRYCADGWTSLYDALGDTFSSALNTDSEISNKIFAIMTDGLDNTSHRYNLYSARDLIVKAQRLGYKVLFIGAFTNSQQIAADLGISPDNSVEINNDANGIKASFDSINLAIKMLREKGTITPDWKRPAEQSKLLAAPGQDVLRLHR